MTEENKGRYQREVYRDLLQVLKLETQKFKTMLQLVQSMGREEAKKAGKEAKTIYALEHDDHLKFIPWNISFLPTQDSTLEKHRHIERRDWKALEEYLKSVDSFLSRISVIEAEPK
jgi:hypothetical protein